MAPSVVLTALLLVGHSWYSSAQETSVTSLEPDKGSLNGGTLITIYGTGFSKNQFSFGDGQSHLGNEVLLESENQVYTCDILRDGCTETQVMCYTRNLYKNTHQLNLSYDVTERWNVKNGSAHGPMPWDIYTLQLSVDGVWTPRNKICHNCRFISDGGRTPKISTISPRSGPPGTVIELKGKIFTDRYGSNREFSSNDRTARVERVYFKGQKCDLVKDVITDISDLANELYGLQLDDETSDYGYLGCKLQGTYVGNLNASILIDGPYGRSFAEPSSRVIMANDEMAMFQSYAEISNVSPHAGSVAGGARLTIRGRHFDQTDAPALVTVGGVPCEDVVVKETEITCTAPPQPQTAPSLVGNRGIVLEVWNVTSVGSVTWDEVAGYPSDPGGGIWLDQTQWTDLPEIPFFSRMKGYFIAPSNNTYQFAIKSDDNSALYASFNGNPDDKELIAECPGYCKVYQAEPQMAAPQILTKDQRVYLEVLHKNILGPANVHVAAYTKESPHRGQSGSPVQSEMQTITISSTVHTEKQTLVFSDFPAEQGGTDEVQTVDILAASLEHAVFRLGMAGVYTGLLAGDESTSEVRRQLNSLASIAPDTVEVQAADITGGRRFTVTFNSDRGDWEDMGTMKHSTSLVDIEFIVTETKKGVPTLGVWILQFGQTLSTPLKRNPTAQQVQTSLESALGVRCPLYVIKPATARYYEDYEKVSGRTTQVEPFCGRSAIRNPNYLYEEGSGSPSVSLHTHGQLCFAFNGLVQSLRFDYSYTTDNSAEEVKSYYYANLAISQTQGWNYVCVDIWGTVESRHVGIVKATLSKIRIYKDGPSLFVDSVFIGSKPTTQDYDGLVNLGRMRPPNEVWLKSVEVTRVDGAAGAVEFQVEMSTVLCAFGLPLIGVHHAQEGVTGSDAATYSSATWPTGLQVVVSRQQSASPAVGHYFDLSSAGTNIPDIPANIAATSLANKLEPFLGEVGVERSGDCTGFSWSIEWISFSGDQPQLTVTNRLSGNEPQIVVETRREGGAWLNPLFGDVLRTAHSVPQVAVAINSIPSRCVEDCSFEWLEASTPSLTAISPNSGSQADSTSLTITGTGFSTVAEENIVTIGGARCEVSSATSGQLVCDVGRGPIGAHDVLLEIGQAGRARTSPGLDQFTYLAQATDLSPARGSVAGGSRLTISGTGFVDSVVVNINNKVCTIESAVYDSIICLTPAQTSAGTHDVDLSHDGAALPSSTQLQFIYDSSLTPVVTSLSSSAGLVQGGQQVTIHGSDFGASATEASVSVGQTLASILSYADDVIQVALPSLGPGSYPLLVYVPGKGWADTSTHSIAGITYTLEVTGLSPDVGSLAGGTRVTVTGAGFSSLPDDMTVSLGDVPCDVTDSSDTRLLCDVSNPGSTVDVTLKLSEGVDAGYVWEPAEVTVEEGDSVRWVWRGPASGRGFLVQQTSSSSSTQPQNNGFSNGDTPTTSGIYTYQFNDAGTYHYWSGSSESAIIRGIVKVGKRASFSAELSVSLAGHEAVQDTSSAATPSSSDACPGTTTSISGCSDSKPTPADPTRFSFAFWSCSTPEVTSISPTQGALGQEVVIKGSGFSTTDCQNEVAIGSQVCVASSSSASEITCVLSSSSGLVIGLAYPVSVRIGNRGSALMKVNGDLTRAFVLLPGITSISPNIGSKKGGTEITITGTDFQGTLIPDVAIDSTACEVVSAADTEIVCVSSQGSSSSATVSVVAKIGDASIPAACTGTCLFNFADSHTPEVTSVSPTTITSVGQVITINGAKLDPPTEVRFGNIPCTVTSASASSVQCILDEPVVGTHFLSLKVSPYGLASTSAKITVDNKLDSVTPAEGSLMGGTLITLNGLGFSPSSTTVTINSEVCSIKSISSSVITCVTPVSSEGTVTLKVVSAGQNYPSLDFTYALSQTPSITGVTPSSASSGETITVSGSGFGTTTSDVEVSIGDIACDVTGLTDTSITCSLGVQSAGVYLMQVYVADKGLASGADNFTNSVTVTSITPQTGSFGGGQLVTVVGKSFGSDSLSVTVCGEPCVMDPAQVSNSQIVCTTPAKSDTGSGTAVCDVQVNVGREHDVLTAAYTYSRALTAVITDVSPGRGGTAGGTSLTITGTGFGSVASNLLSVTIAGTPCPIQQSADTQIVCVTEAHSQYAKTKVQVHLSQHGIATQDKADFEYADAWSSAATWGGADPPVAGDLVVIPANMTIILDTDTPVLRLLLIKGGALIFDEADLELNAEVILITEGGLLQVGTEAEPFQHKAIITLHGHVLSKELPIYGTKMIAVREGSLELHGKPQSTTWTRLATTAHAGDSSITLQQSVSWTAGDQVVIATTGNHVSQGQSEVRTITAVSPDGTTLTLDSVLDNDHLGETVPLAAGIDFEARAEVGLLTHNVLVRGSEHEQWKDKIEACPHDFNVGEFVTQTCFQGKFGEELGSDQFGAQIIMHAPRPSENLVQAHIENVELWNMGQAFRLGRYAIHYHLLGDMTGSYVRGCSIHLSFNRAVNIHDTHNVMVEGNVIYNIMGGAFFLEDGIETGNTLQYNLAVFVKQSSSLQNDDITPAAFWVTNANNTVQHNAVAGGTHFGFWYRMHGHPGGPSFNANICPQRVPLGVFHNNTAHSLGWFGLWIFPHFYPKVGGDCDSTEPETASFTSLTAWNCKKGAEWGSSGALQFVDFKLVNNVGAGIEMKLVGKDGAMIKDTIIAAHPQTANAMEWFTTERGIILPYSYGLTVNNVNFINFDVDGSAAYGVTTISGMTERQCGGFCYDVTQLKFTNSNNKVAFRWEHEAVLRDIDGSLCGIQGCKVVATTPTLPPSCNVDASMSAGDTAGSVCSSAVEFHRFSFNGALPSSLEGKIFSITNQYGTSLAHFKTKRLTHRRGWMALLVSGEAYNSYFVNADQLTNISYTGVLYDLKPGTFIILGQNMTQRPDVVSLNPDTPNRAEFTSAMRNGVGETGDWYYDEDEKAVYMLLNGDNVTRSDETNFDVSVNMDIQKCYWRDCVPPPEPGSEPPAAAAPEEPLLWSDRETWKNAAEGYGGNYGNGDYGPPNNDKDVVIRAGDWVLVDTELPLMNTLYIYGVLEFRDEVDSSTGLRPHHVLNCNLILISGGRLVVGWEDKPFMARLDIILRGDHSSPETLLPGGPALGAKALGVFGGLDLHGVGSVVPWARLANTAAVGDRRLVLDRAVDWAPGAALVLATSGYDPHQTEIVHVQAVNQASNTVDLEEALQYRHTAVTERVSGVDYVMAAEVGLLSRNIRVIGQEYPEQVEKAFGARVLVGMYYHGHQDHIGYARLSNVEFYHTGQEGWRDAYDPRYSLAFLDVGDVTDVRPSYVRACAFHHGFAPAIGVFGTHSLALEDNVIHHTVGSAIISAYSADTQIHRNLVTLVLFPGGYNGRGDVQFTWDAGVNVAEASGPDLTGNVVAGSERTGFHVRGEYCRDNPRPWRDNTAHGVLDGVQTFPTDGLSDCTRISGFTVYRAFDFGFYHQVASNKLEVTGIVSIDNTVGLFPMVIHPASKAHLRVDKVIHVTNSLFIGSSSAFDCEDSPDKESYNFRISAEGRSWFVHGGGKTGMAIGMFQSGTNAAPEKGWTKIKTYQAIAGVTIINDVTFARFGAFCRPNTWDVCLGTGPSNEDAFHPTKTGRITLIDVEANSKIYFHRPHLSKIVPADCVDMDCDGYKKVLVEDLDASLLGSVGAVVSQSEYEWNGDRRRGLGDYRIPATMLTRLDGSRIPVDSIAPNKGIIRNQNCKFLDVSQAWQCEDLDYEMLMLESMDSDTESRRLSPVAVLGGGYVDLVNGPQEHGWCLGYTCHKRLSTFPIILAMGKHYTIHYTGTSPQGSRLHLLNSQSSQAVVVAIWYASPSRLEVYVGNNYIPPNNAYTENGQQLLSAPTSDNQYVPDVNSDPTGNNYWERDTRLLNVLVRGDLPVEIRSSELIIVTFKVPPMTVEEFFGKRIIQNLALFLDIPEIKIRIASAVRSSRRRRSVESSYTIEIGNEAGMAGNVLDPGFLTHQRLLEVMAKLVNAVQLNTLPDVLGLSLLGVTVIEPAPPVDEPTWQNYTLQLENGGFNYLTIQVPMNMEVDTEPVARPEGLDFSTHPVLHAVDSQGNHVSQLGSSQQPWEATVVLGFVNGSDSRAVLKGNTTVLFVDGWAHFTGLSVSHSGTYRLKMAVTQPTGTQAALEVTSGQFVVPPRHLVVKMGTHPGKATVGEPFSVDWNLLDMEMKEEVKELGWKGQTWKAEVSLFMPEISPANGLMGNWNVFIEPTTGKFEVSNLSLNTSGAFFLEYRIMSTPEEHNIRSISVPIYVFPANFSAPDVETESRVGMRFEADFQTVVGWKENMFGALVYNKLWPLYRVTMDNFEVSEGSIMVDFNVSGSTQEVRDALHDTWERIKAPLTLTFNGNEVVAGKYMTVDGKQFYGLDDIPGGLSDESLVIILVVCGLFAVVLVVIIAVVLVVKSSKQGKMRLNHSTDTDPEEEKAVPPGVPARAILYEREPSALSVDSDGFKVPRLSLSAWEDPARPGSASTRRSVSRLSLGSLHMGRVSPNPSPRHSVDSLAVPTQHRSSLDRTPSMLTVEEI